MNLRKIKQIALKEIKQVKDLKALESLYKKYLGKKGEITQILRSLKKIPQQKRIKSGKEANELKNFLEKKIKEKKSFFIALDGAKKDKEKQLFDVTLPGMKPMVGHLHPLTQVKRKVEEIFQGMGFSIAEGPEVESEWYNFDALNIPKDHPARDAWDTFYLKNGLLLRTHTSPVQIRYMKKNQPPLRIIAPGRAFRYEATDASHEINFYQLEGLMVGKNVSVVNFKAIMEDFFQRYFQKPIKIRLRPGFFPFVEPGFEVDMTCLNCGKKGCSVCSKTGWIEMMGAGMVHPNVFKACGLNPKNWQGFAFGIGLDRLAMMKYKINDIRLFYNGDLKFLQQF